MNKKFQLMEYITQDAIAYMVKDRGIDFDKAMHQFYTSATYEKLMEACINRLYDSIITLSAHNKRSPHASSDNAYPAVPAALASPAD